MPNKSGEFASVCRNRKFMVKQADCCRKEIISSEQINNWAAASLKTHQ